MSGLLVLLVVRVVVSQLVVASVVKQAVGMPAGSSRLARRSGPVASPNGARLSAVSIDSEQAAATEHP